MKSTEVSKTRRYCGRSFSDDEISWIRDLIARQPQANRVRLSQLVSESLAWLRPDGRLKEMSCRVAMLRMQRDGLIPHETTAYGGGPQQALPFRRG